MGRMEDLWWEVLHPTGHCLRPPSLHTHTYQPHINVTGSERSLSPLQISTPPHLTTDSNSHRTCSPRQQPQERNTESQPDKYTKVLPGRSWPSEWARAPNHPGHTNPSTSSC